MSTGDIAGNIAKLRLQLKHVGWKASVDEVGLRLGDPLAVLPLLNHVLLKYSKHVTKWILDHGIELHGKTDQRFVEHAFKLFRDTMGLRPVITPAQFLEHGYAERKVLLLCEAIDAARRIHTQLARQQRLAAAKAYKQGSKLFQDYWDTGEVRIERKAGTEIVNVMHKQPGMATDAAQDMYDLRHVFTDVGGGQPASAGIHWPSSWMADDTVLLTDDAEGEAAQQGGAHAAGHAHASAPAAAADEVPGWLAPPSRLQQLAFEPQEVAVFHMRAAASPLALRPASPAAAVAMARAMTPPAKRADGGIAVRGVAVSSRAASPVQHQYQHHQHQHQSPLQPAPAPAGVGEDGRPVTPAVPQHLKSPAAGMQQPSPPQAMQHAGLQQKHGDWEAAAAASAAAQQQPPGDSQGWLSVPQPAAQLQLGGPSERDLLSLVVSLQDRLAAVEGDAERARAEQQQAAEALQGRVTVLEGRVRFMENQLAAAQAQHQQQQPAAAAPGPALGSLLASRTPQKPELVQQLPPSPAVGAAAQRPGVPGGLRGSAAAAWQLPASGAEEAGGNDWLLSGMGGVHASMGAARTAARNAGAALARSTEALSPPRRPAPWQPAASPLRGAAPAPSLLAEASRHGTAAAASNLARQSTQDLIHSLAARYSQAQQQLQDYRTRPAHYLP